MKAKSQAEHVDIDDNPAMINRDGSPDCDTITNELASTCLNDDGQSQVIIR